MLSETGIPGLEISVMSSYFLLELVPSDQQLIINDHKSANVQFLLFLQTRVLGNRI